MAFYREFEEALKKQDYTHWINQWKTDEYKVLSKECRWLEKQQELDCREAKIKNQEEEIEKEWKKIEMKKNEIAKMKNELYDGKELSDILQM